MVVHIHPPTSSLHVEYAILVRVPDHLQDYPPSGCLFNGVKTGAAQGSSGAKKEGFSMNEWILLIIGAVVTAALVGGLSLLTRTLGGNKNKPT